MEVRSETNTERGPSRLARAGFSKHRLIVGALLGATAIVTVPLLGMAGGATTDATQPGAVQAAALPTPVTEGFSGLVEAVSPAVVNIATTGNGAVAMSDDMPRFDMPQFPEDSPFGELFRKFFEQQSQREGADKPRAERTRSLGSGFIIDAAGYVVTNNHVVDGAENIEVTLSDGRSYDAELVGGDVDTDIALLKLEEGAKDLPTVSWGDSDKAKVGDWVVAVGNPFGLGGSVSAGIISARGRNIQAGPYDDFLQIDAPINRGNSGGPAFNTEGEVIGINTAIYSPTGGSVGIGFAIPASLAKPVVDQLREHGEVQRGWLGVYIQDLTPELAEGLGIAQNEGALVASVVPGSPAEEAGLQSGDVIVSFAGTKIGEAHQLPKIVAGTAVGAKADLKVLRDGTTKTFAVEIDKREASVADSQAAPGASSNGSLMSELGMSVAKLTPELRERFDLADDVEGVVVTEVDSSGPAAEQGIRPGDVISRVGQHDVTSASDIKDEVAAAKKQGRESLVALVKRGRQERFVALGVPAA
jgi:serine protease Do